MYKLVLASKSPRRIQILKDAGFKFISVPANINEEEYLNLKPIVMVRKLSLLKAKKISKEYKDCMVIAADTTVALGDLNLGKPQSIDDARRILKLLSGKEHYVITGFTIIKPGSKNKTLTDKTKIYFKILSEEEIENYIQNNEVLDKAGAYAIQEGAGGFVKSYIGDYLNIVGLPTKALTILKKELE